MKKHSLLLALLAVALGLYRTGSGHAAGIQDIDVIVVIHAENRSFDHLGC
jgi:phospholipase C